MSEGYDMVAELRGMRLKIEKLEEQFYGKVNMFENWLLKIEKVLLSCILGTTLSKDAKRMLLAKFDGKEKTNHALDSLLHAVAPVPLIEVNKLLIAQKQELISDFKVDAKTLRQCKEVECVTCDEIIEKWEERST